MSAAEALRAARTAGIRVTVDGDDLVLEARAPPPRSILDDLRCCKADNLALLRSPTRAWSVEDWRALFATQTAISERKFGLDRADAERRALDDLITEWLICHPPTCSDVTAGCVYCGGPDGDGKVLLPVLAGGGHTWVHDRCHQDWMEERSSEARDALAFLGISSRA
jgi:hypothetical protein